jgi:hypothetical protein
MDFDEREYINLEPNYEVLDLGDHALIAFDRLVVDFRDEKVIGERKLLKGVSEELKWSGSIKVGDETYGEEFIEVATNMGFNTLRKENSQLFSGQKAERPKLPRFLIGAKLTELNIQMKEEEMKYNFDPMKCRTDLLIEWNVLDKKRGQVVMKSEHLGSFQFRQEVYQNSDYIQKAYVNSLISFLSSGEFQELIKDADGFEPKEIFEEVKLESTIIQQAEALEFEDFSDLVKQVNKACVSVITDGGFGSGAIIDQSGYVLTAYHVIEGVNKVEVKFASGIQMPAEVINYSSLNDLAILKINGNGYPALKIAEEADAGLGDDIFTIGTPADLELGQSISRGIVSGKRKIEGQIYLQLDMAVSPGNSGGPLLNQKGEVIGVVLRKIIDEGVEGIGFAVPSKELIEALNLVVD